MAFDYPNLRDNLVEVQLADKGKTGSLYVNNPGAGVPYESQFGDETAHPVTVLQTQFKKADNNGTLIEMNDVLFMVGTEGLTIDPEMADRIKVNGVTYQVVRIDPLYPGDTILFWYVHARK